MSVIAPSPPTLPAGSCKHRPISNGWSNQSTRQPDGSFKVIDSRVWCGYCKGYIEMDAEWQEKFRAAGKYVPPLVGDLS